MLYSMLWKAWYKPERLKMNFPSSWEISLLNMKDSLPIPRSEILNKINNPYESKILKDIAKGKKNAVIAVDDLTRPTKASQILPIVIKELLAGGIKHENILILIALGAHPAMHRIDLIRKLGKYIVNNFTVYNHSPFHNLVSFGKTSYNTPVYINKFFAESDVKIGIGSILPHPTAGFGGGGKIVLPGVAGVESILKNHTPTISGESGGLFEVENNDNRLDIEEAARMAKLDFTINQVCSGNGEIAGIFAGDFVSAHREGVKFALKIYATMDPKKIFDILVVNAFPMDTNLIQIGKGLNVIRPGFEDLIHPNGSIVFIGACPEGRGYHYLCDYQLPLWHTLDKNTHINRVVEKRDLFVLSPNLRQKDVDDFFPIGTRLCKNWNKVNNYLENKHLKKAKVGIFPYGSLQILESR